MLAEGGAHRALMNCSNPSRAADGARSRLAPVHWGSRASLDTRTVADIEGRSIRRPASMRCAGVGSDTIMQTIKNSWSNSGRHGCRRSTHSGILWGGRPGVHGVSRPDLYRRAAASVDKILKGARPLDLPVEQATGSELVVNGRAAKALGSSSRSSSSMRGDRVARGRKAKPAD